MIFLGPILWLDSGLSCKNPAENSARRKTGKKTSDLYSNQNSRNGIKSLYPFFLQFQMGKVRTTRRQYGR